MVNLKTIAATAAAGLLSTSVFANTLSLRIAPEFNTVSANKIEDKETKSAAATRDNTNYSQSQGMTIGADYQVVEGVPVAVGGQATFAKTLGNNVEGQTPARNIEGAMTVRGFADESMTGLSAVQPFAVVGYSLGHFSQDMESSAEAGDDAADNKDVVNSGLQHGLLLQVGNEVKLTDTVGLTVAYQYTNKASSLVKSNVKDAKDEDKDNRRVSSHGWSAGVRVAL